MPEASEPIPLAEKVTVAVSAPTVNIWTSNLDIALCPLPLVPVTVNV
ncbi:MAG: hypothetical protein QXE92_00090 [Thermofilaceae archaeon]